VTSSQQSPVSSARVGVTGAVRAWAVIIACLLVPANGLIAFAGLIGFAMNDTGNSTVAVVTVGVLMLTLVFGLVNIALFILQGMKVAPRAHKVHRGWVVGLTVFGGIVVALPLGFYLFSLADSFLHITS
jgi:hypothetical protein